MLLTSDAFLEYTSVDFQVNRVVYYEFTSFKLKKFINLININLVESSIANMMQMGTHEETYK